MKILGICLLFMITVLQGNKWAGVCFNNLEVLSDQQLILSALNESFENEIQLQPSDITASSYLTNHPECCTVVRRYDPFSHSIFSKSFKTIYLNYQIKIKAQDYLGGAKFNQKWLSVNQCGEIIETSSFGSTSDESSINTYR